MAPSGPSGWPASLPASLLWSLRTPGTRRMPAREETVCQEVLHEAARLATASTAHMGRHQSASLLHQPQQLELFRLRLQHTCRHFLCSTHPSGPYTRYPAHASAAAVDVTSTVCCPTCGCGCEGGRYQQCLKLPETSSSSQHRHLHTWVVAACRCCVIALHARLPAS
jgi:hypothetical protein